MSIEDNRIAITEFLQCNDKQVSYTDRERNIEGVPKMTYEEAIKHFFGVLNDDFYYSVADNIFEITYEDVIKLAKENGFYEKINEKLELLFNEKKPTVDLYRTLLS